MYKTPKKEVPVKRPVCVSADSCEGWVSSAVSL